MTYLINYLDVVMVSVSPKNLRVILEELFVEQCAVRERFFLT